MVPSKVGMQDVVGRPSWIKMSNEDIVSVECHGSIDIVLWSFAAPRKMILINILCILALSFNLYFLRAATDLEYIYQGNIEGVALYLKEGEDTLFPPRGQTSCLEVSELSSAGDHAYAAMASGIDQMGSCVDVNEFYAACLRRNKSAA